MTTSPHFVEHRIDPTAWRPATLDNAETNGDGYGRFMDVKERITERRRQPPPSTLDGYLHELPGERDAAQAVELVRALCDKLGEMTYHLAWVESRDVTTTSQAGTKRLEAAALRRDIAEAQRHIDRLQRRYLNGAERTTSTWTAAPRAMVSLAESTYCPS
jgi:hypothetical protein